MQELPNAALTQQIPDIPIIPIQVATNAPCLRLFFLPEYVYDNDELPRPLPAGATMGQGRSGRLSLSWVSQRHGDSVSQSHIDLVLPCDARAQ